MVAMVALPHHTLLISSSGTLLVHPSGVTPVHKQSASLSVGTATGYNETKLMLFLVVVWVLSWWCLHLFGNTLLIPQQSHVYEWRAYELPRDVWKYSILRAFNQNTFCSETSPVPTHLLYTILRSLHSRKLHILGFRARTVCTNSLVIFFFSLSDKGTYHFWSLSLPCRLKRSMNCIWNEEMTQKQRGSE